MSFLPGATADYPLPGAFKTDQGLVSAAELLRGPHDASSDFVVGSEEWWFTAPVEPAEVICHGDFAPYNCVVVDGAVVGVFDFDTAHPGPRLWDVAYGAYRWAPLTCPSNPDGFGDIDEQARRLRLFCDAYGEADRSAVLETAATRLRVLIETMHRLAAEGNGAFARHIEEGHDQIYLNDIAHLTDNATTLTTG